MRSYRNPFLYRTSEQQQQQGLQRFLKTYGADVIDLLPEELWDRPIVIRSAPGGGKTSLLRAFTTDTLKAIHDRRDEYEDLHRRMLDLGAIDTGGPALLGVRVSLSRDYRDLIDLGLDEGASRKIFLRFLDAHIVRAFLSSAFECVGSSVADGASLMFVRATSEGEGALESLGGGRADKLWSWAGKTVVQTRNLIDSVLPVEWDGISGHGTLYSLRALSGAKWAFNGEELPLQPLLMFDDGHDLADSQRRDLLTALTDRDLDLSRWYTERYSALRPDEVLGDGEPNRGHVVVHIERDARSMGGSIRRGHRLRPFESMLIDVADRRASKALADYGDETANDFSEFLDAGEDDVLRDVGADVVPVLRQRVLALTGNHPRYEAWVSEAASLAGYAAVLRWRELEIVVTRDRDRSQLELLDLPLTADDLRAQSGSALREAAALFLRDEFRIPYYFGPQRIARLASQNIEQSLQLDAALFEEMLALLTLRRRPWLTPQSQDRIVRVVSDELWRAIPLRRAHGRDVQHLLLRIAALAQRDTYRPKAPYAPGVSGTALSMRDRALLLDPDVRARTPGAEALYRALGAAIGHNLLSAELNRSVKGDRWMVLYLNRLLCARFNLPVSYGGFRERRLEDMCKWMSEPVPGDLSGVHEPAMLEL